MHFVSCRVVNWAIWMLFPLALAAPAPPEQANVPVEISIQRDRITSQTQIEVFDQASSEVLGVACSSVLDSGLFKDHAIRVDMNKAGVGNLTLGSKTYKLRRDVRASGGIECTKIYDDKEMEVVCQASLPASLVSSSGQKPQKPAADCFERPFALDVRGFLNAAIGASHPADGGNDTAAGLLPPGHNDAEHGPEKRQMCFLGATTVLATHPNPHQDFLHKQLSEAIHCGAAAACSVGVSSSKSYTIEASATASFTTWIGGGFAVSYSKETGKNYGCEGEEGDSVCMWYSMAHTAYTVKNAHRDSCSGQVFPGGRGFVMRSPNDNNDGGNYYCVIGTCRNQGDAYWSLGRPGGP